jgi:hypothetical protein
MRFRLCKKSNHKKSFLVNALWRKCKFEGKEKWQLSFSVQWHLLTSLFTCFYIPCAKTCRFYWLPWTDLMKNVTNLFFVEENLIMELLRLHEIQHTWISKCSDSFEVEKKVTNRKNSLLCFWSIFHTCMVIIRVTLNGND